MPSPPSPSKIRVAVIEDDERMVSALSAALSAAPEFELVQVARSLGEALLVLEQRPQIVLLDLRLPDGSGLDFLEHLRDSRHCARAIVLSVLADAETVVRAIELGAAGYLEKGATALDVIQMIRVVLEGGAPLSARVAAHVLTRIRAEKDAPAPPEPLEAALSQREIEILRAIAKGLSFKEVARVHGISPHTVTDHVKSIYKKLAVHSRGEAVFEARQAGLLQTED